MNDWPKRIYLDRSICHGRPHIRGTRITVSLILDLLSDGITADEIVRKYPPLVIDDVRAALAYAADLARTVKPNENIRTAVKNADEWQEFIRETAGSITDPTFERHGY